MWNSFNEVSELEKDKEYVCVIDNEDKHIFETMQDANDFIMYKSMEMNYNYAIHNIKCKGRQK